MIQEIILSVIALGSSPVEPALKDAVILQSDINTELVKEKPRSGVRIRNKFSNVDSLVVNKIVRRSGVRI